jgi:hypothetical protein
MTDTDLSNSGSEHVERNNRSAERLDTAIDRTESGARRDEHLSGGRRDRSREMLRAELEAAMDDAKRADGRPSWKPSGRGADVAKQATAEDGPPAAAGQGAEPGAAAAPQGPPRRPQRDCPN